MVSTNLCSWFHLLQKGLNIVVSSISFILKITKDNERIKYYPQKNFTQFKSGSSIETWKKTAGPKNIVHMGKGIAREKQARRLKEQLQKRRNKPFSGDLWKLCWFPRHDQISNTKQTSFIFNSIYSKSSIFKPTISLNSVPLNPCNNYCR